MDVGDWLRGLGLAQYEAAFRDNEVDGKILPKLTAEDLKELGVVAVGHRRAILAAIEELSGGSAGVAKPASVAPDLRSSMASAVRSALDDGPGC